MILSLTVIATLLGALVIMLMPPDRKEAIRWVALAAALLSLIFSLVAFFSYDMAQTEQFQFRQDLPWIQALQIRYIVAADGISLPLLILTGFIITTGVLIAWNIEDRVKEFFVLLLLLVAGVYGVFISLDLFLLFIFYELAVVPMYLLIGVWGSTRKEYGAMKLTLYLMVGSALILLGMVILYIHVGGETLDLTRLAQRTYPHGLQLVLFPLMFIGFGVLAGLWPLHTWSPVGHVAAPTSVSMLHAGVLMKLGAYGCLRVAIWLFPEGARAWLPWIIALTAVNVVYGSLVAMVQKDFKYVIGYSSVSHMGFVVMGLAALNVLSISGAVLQMFSHGIMTGLFFAIVGRMVYDRTHTRDLDKLGGLIKPLPAAAVLFIIAGLASMGMPGLSGFIAELMILLGVWEAYPVIAVLCGIAIVVTAAYILRVIHRAFFGELKETFADLPPITFREKLSGVMLAALLLLIGLWPSLMTDMIFHSVGPLVEGLR